MKFQRVIINPVFRRILGNKLSTKLLSKVNEKISSESYIAHSVRIFQSINNISIGEGSVISYNCEFHAWGNIHIGKNVIISPQTILLTGSHDIQTQEYGSLIKPIFIDDYAWIAYRAIVLPGVKIGKGAVVGAGSIVTKNVEPWSIVAGNPAKTIKSRGIKDLTYVPASWYLLKM
jgi:maltose O-acetyltransferase